MDILTLQNFYKDAVKVAWTAGAGNFYVNTKPVPTSGFLVVNPSSASKREIIRYSAVGTDGTGDYITVSSVADRGLGGTTAQTHAVDEPIRMNITAEHWDNIQDAIDQLQADLAVAILAGASFASPTVAGIARLTNAPDKSIGTVTISIATPAVISRTAHGMLVNDRVKFTTTGALPTGIVASTEYYVITAGLTADVFRISATMGGTAINTTGSQSGVHTLVRTTPYVVEDNDARIPTTAEKARIPSVDEDAAMAGGGDYGTPSASNKFITKDYNASPTGLPVTTVYTTVDTVYGAATTQFDISNPAGTTFRYTWDGNGTDPGITAIVFPIGSSVTFRGANFNSANNGTFLVTGSGTDYIEVTNASGVAETNKTLGTGYFSKGVVYTKSALVKYIDIEVQAPGGNGGGASTASAIQVGYGGSGGGYARKRIPTSSISTTTPLSIGDKNTSTTFAIQKIASFGNTVITIGGTAQDSTAGTSTGGDINIAGQRGGIGVTSSSQSDGNALGQGGDSMLGLGGQYRFISNNDDQNGYDATGYGAGGSGAYNTNNAGNPTTGGLGTQGIVIITEYFS